MARIKNNPLVQGASGNVGKKFVYRKRGKDTFITLMPEINENAKPTQQQEKVREQFQAASGYATSVIADAKLKAQYQKKAKAKSGVTAYNIAFRDFLKAPVVKKTDTTKYTGSPGSPVVITATDDFRVVEVAVSIKTAAGVLVEEGNAMLNPMNRDEWIYTATQNNAALTGSVILATAKDLPGNKGTLQTTV